jgi:membrane-associated protease RseP (regulator of RpoE activity)
MHKVSKRIVYQSALFVVTFICTTFAGSQWSYGTTIYSGNYTWQDFQSGLAYSIPLLLILTVHEFGHYFVALFHNIKTSLPYYIPFPPIPYFPINIGTMGAVIRLRSRPRSNVQNFDVGVAGPLAGFIVALVILFYGFQTLPPADYIYQFHPEYEQYGENYADVVYSEEYLRQQGGGSILDIKFGNTLLFWLFEQTVDDPARIPNPRELMHYPVLLACYIALLFTCLNLLPIGQLDGGHVVYGLFGFKTHRLIARIFFLVLVFYSGLGLTYIDPALPQEDLMMGIAGYLLFLYLAFRGLNLQFTETIMYVLLMFAFQFLLMVYMPGIKGYEGWLLFAFVIGRFVGVEHPPCEIEQPLDANRVMLGWIALVMFVLCFSPAPFQLQIITG